MAQDVRTWQPMDHRKQATDVMGRIARVAGFAMLVSLFFPTVRRTLAEFGFVAVILSLFVVTGLLGFGIYRWKTRIGRLKTAGENPFAPLADDPELSWHQDEPEAPLELLGPAMRRRYPWRH
jgi:hypothetical protein